MEIEYFGEPSSGDVEIKGHKICPLTYTDALKAAADYLHKKQMTPKQTETLLSGLEKVVTEHFDNNAGLAWLRYFTPEQSEFMRESNILGISQLGMMNFILLAQSLLKRES